MEDEAPLVMFVDDNAAFLEVVGPVVQAQGYRVRCCSGPAEALAMMRAQRPHVVVTDVMMTGLDAGFSLSRQIKEDPQLADIPVIIVTAMSSRRGFDFHPRTPEELAAMHADAFLGKPVAPLTLLSTIKELLARRDRTAAGGQ